MLTRRVGARCISRRDAVRRPSRATGYSTFRSTTVFQCGTRSVRESRSTSTISSTTTNRLGPTSRWLSTPTVPSTSLVYPPASSRGHALARRRPWTTFRSTLRTLMACAPSCSRLGFGSDPINWLSGPPKGHTVFRPRDSGRQHRPTAHGLRDEDPTGDQGSRASACARIQPVARRCHLAGCPAPRSSA